MRRSFYAAIALAALALSSPAYASEQTKPSDVCNAENMKDPQIAEECRILGEAREMSEALAKSMKGLDQSIKDMGDAFKKLLEQDLKLQMQLAPGKHI